ncbi:MAG: nicotinate-nucleotide adenylyltransferase [Anaerovoracaceae bacterium]|jgi:nicotinate-nucleotide adenylyltransferase
MKKIGILGGTFDPIHYGHLILGEQAREDAQLDEIIFMPAMVQPFKLHTKAADPFHRLEMLKLATAENPYFSVSEMELNNPGVSYTIDTLRGCEKKYGEYNELHFIIGTDAFLNMEKWYKAEDLLTEFAFVVGTRPSYKEKELKARIKEFREKFGTHIIEINNSEVEISSTDIKKRLYEGKSIKYLLPEAVEQYIYNNKLYNLPETER